MNRLQALNDQASPQWHQSLNRRDRMVQLLDPLKGDERISVAVRGVDAKGADGDVFLGEPMLFEQANTLLDIFVPGGAWQMAVALTPGSNNVTYW